MADRQSQFKWRVHESTARSACRLAFLTLGLLPLALCLVWSAQVFLPTYQRQQSSSWESMLSAQLGTRLKIAAVEALAPQRFALHEIRLLHAETGVEMGRVRRADVERGGGKWVVRLTDAELEGAQLAETWKAFHDWFLCRPRHAAHAAVIEMDALTLHGAGGSRGLQDMLVELRPGSDTTELLIQFRHAMVQAPGKQTGAGQLLPSSELNFTRYHQSTQQRTEVQLQTGTAPLACSLLAPLSPLLGRLGDLATFTGTLDATLDSANWKLRITNGQLRNLDVAQLTANSEAAVSGQGDMTFKELVVGQSGIEAAYGLGEIRSGKMTSGLFHALGKHLGVALRPTNQVSSYGFDRCDFGFDLREPSLYLYCALSDALGPLAARSQAEWGEPLPLENIIAALQSCAVETEQMQPPRLPTTWLTKQALMWLPLGSEQAQAAKAQLRLSSHQNPEHQ